MKKLKLEKIILNFGEEFNLIFEVSKLENTKLMIGSLKKKPSIFLENCFYLIKALVSCLFCFITFLTYRCKTVLNDVFPAHDISLYFFCCISVSVLCMKPSSADF